MLLQTQARLAMAHMETEVEGQAEIEAMAEQELAKELEKERALQEQQAALAKRRKVLLTICKMGTTSSTSTIPMVKQVRRIFVGVLAVPYASLMQSLLRSFVSELQVCTTPTPPPPPPPPPSRAGSASSSSKGGTPRPGERWRDGRGGGRERWGNSGGTNREYYRGYYLAKGRGKDMDVNGLHVFHQEILMAMLLENCHGDFQRGWMHPLMSKGRAECVRGSVRATAVCRRIRLACAKGLEKRPFTYSFSGCGCGLAASKISSS